MEVFEAIEKRRSIRKYADKKIEDEKLKKIVDAGRLAPSANNAQEWKFIVINNDEKRKEITEATGMEFIGQAPTIIVACATESDKKMFCGQMAYTVDLSIAFSYMILEAAELGIGSCWIGHFDEQKVKDALGIPESIRVVAIAPFGYPDEEPEARPRKSIEDVACFI